MFMGSLYRFDLIYSLIIGVHDCLYCSITLCLMLKKFGKISKYLIDNSTHKKKITPVGHALNYFLMYHIIFYIQVGYSHNFQQFEFNNYSSLIF